MAKFNVTGLGELQLSLEEVAGMPEEIKDKMLEAGAAVGVKALKQSISSLGIIDTKQLHDSITAGQPKTDKNGVRVLYVYPRGSRKDTYVGMKLRRVSIKGKRKNGTSVKMTNADVGFIMEFGAPKRGIRARHWMRSAIESFADEATQKQRAVYDEWLNSKGL